MGGKKNFKIKDAAKGFVPNFAKSNPGKSNVDLSKFIFRYYEIYDKRRKPH